MYSTFVLQDISVRGFWMTAWNKKNHNTKERIEMFEELARLFREKKLHAPPYKIVPFSNYQEAIVNSLKIDGKQGLKYILNMEKN